MFLPPKVCPEGYLMIRKDRGGSRIGGGVEVIYRNDWQINVIDKPEEFDDAR